jgi:hypothetical protein
MKPEEIVQYLSQLPRLNKTWHVPGYALMEMILTILLLGLSYCAYDIRGELVANVVGPYATLLNLYFKFIGLFAWNGYLYLFFCFLALNFVGEICALWHLGDYRFWKKLKILEMGLNGNDPHNELLLTNGIVCPYERGINNFVEPGRERIVDVVKLLSDPIVDAEITMSMCHYWTASPTRLSEDGPDTMGRIEYKVSAAFDILLIILTSFRFLSERNYELIKFTKVDASLSYMRAPAEYYPSDPTDQRAEIMGVGKVKHFNPKLAQYFVRAGCSNAYFEDKQLISIESVMQVVSNPMLYSLSKDFHSIIVPQIEMNIKNQHQINFDKKMNLEDRVLGNTIAFAISYVLYKRNTLATTSLKVVASSL